jgi:hypothetical protein
MSPRSKAAVPSTDTTAAKPRALKAWEMQLARFDCEHAGRRVSVKRWEEMSSAFRGEPVRYQAVRYLRERPEYRAFCEALRSQGYEAARQLFTSQALDYVSLHMWGAQRAKEKDDVRALPAFTVPALDRVMPKHDAPIVATQVTITLTPRQMENLEIGGTEQILEAEVLPPETVASNDAPSAEDEGRTPREYTF